MRKIIYIVIHCSATPEGYDYRAKVVGHRDLNRHKDCPCYDVKGEG